jgi:hypothetical protein
VSNNELFTHVGPRVELGDVAISSDDAESFRQTALKGVKIKKLLVADHETLIQTTAFTDGILSDASADYDIYSMAVYSKSVLGDTPDFWRSVISFARFNAKNADTKIYNIYDVESYEGTPVRAVRTVRIIRNLSRLAFDDNGEPVQDTYSRQHKAFEVQMTPDDVSSVDQQVERIVNRSRVTRGH